MRKSQIKIAFLTINRFDPFLCDGVSVSNLELLGFLNNYGYQVANFAFCTNEPYKQQVFYWAFNKLAKQSKMKNRKSFSYLSGNILIEYEQLPFHQAELPINKEYVLKSMIQKLSDARITHIITVEDDFLSLLTGSILGIPGSHFFHSPAYVSNFKGSSFFSKLMKNRALFAASDFLRAKLKREIGLTADLWYPLFDLGRYRSKDSWGQKKKLGFYSAGHHKGDEIINQLALNLPEWQFTVVGRQYSHRFKETPKNLIFWGDNPNFKRFYESIDLLLVPSLIEEGFPRVILEAAVNGIPAIANSLGGIPEAIAGSGILIDTNLPARGHLNINKLAANYHKWIQRIGADTIFFRELQKKAFARARSYEKKQAALSTKNLKKMLS